LPERLRHRLDLGGGEAAGDRNVAIIESGGPCSRFDLCRARLAEFLAVGPVVDDEADALSRESGDVGGEDLAWRYERGVIEPVICTSLRHPGESRDLVETRWDFSS
jgi:hypothetical protein